MKNLYPELSDRKLVRGLMHPKGKLVAENPHFNERSRQEVRKLADGVSKEEPRRNPTWENSSDEAYAAMAKKIRDILDRIHQNSRFMGFFDGVGQSMGETGKDFSETMGDVAHGIFGDLRAKAKK